MTTVRQFKQDLIGALLMGTVWVTVYRMNGSQKSLRDGAVYAAGWVTVTIVIRWFRALKQKRRSAESLR